MMEGREEGRKDRGREKKGERERVTFTNTVTHVLRVEGHVC